MLMFLLCFDDRGERWKHRGAALQLQQAGAGGRALPCCSYSC